MKCTPNWREYSYDASGNIETISQGGQVIKYYYNELNELVREDNQVLDKTVTYSFDGGGNLLAKIEYDYTTGTLGAPRVTHSYAYGDANWKDKLTSYDGKGITYDAIGNPLTYNGWTYTWEEGRQLASLNGNGYTIENKYNADSIRTSKTINGVTTNYHLVGDKVTYETNGTDTIYFTYDSTGNLVSMSLNGVEYYYIRNAQGDIIGLFDSAGTQVVSYAYDSWGKVVSITGSQASTVGAKNPYRYRGYRYDTETGLYYLQSRYYNPEWGRFVNADGLVGKSGELLGHNMFIYCKNNPVNFSDPTGLSPWSALKDAISTAFTVVTSEIWGTISKIYSWFSWGFKAEETKSDINQTIANHTANVVDIGASESTKVDVISKNVKIREIPGLTDNRTEYINQSLHAYEQMRDLNMVTANKAWDGLSSQEQDYLKSNFRLWDTKNLITIHALDKTSELTKEGIKAVMP